MCLVIVTPALNYKWTSEALSLKKNYFNYMS